MKRELPSFYRAFLKARKEEQNTFLQLQKKLEDKFSQHFSDEIIAEFFLTSSRTNHLFQDAKELISYCFISREGELSLFEQVNPIQQIQLYNMLLYGVYRMSIGLDSMSREEEIPYLKAVLKGEEVLHLSSEEKDKRVEEKKYLVKSYSYKRINEWNVLYSSKS